MGALEVAQGVQEVLLEVQVRVVLIILVKSILSLVVHLVKRKKSQGNSNYSTTDKFNKPSSGSNSSSDKVESGKDSSNSDKGSTQGNNNYSTTDKFNSKAPNNQEGSSKENNKYENNDKFSGSSNKSYRSSNSGGFSFFDMLMLNNILNTFGNMFSFMFIRRPFIGIGTILLIALIIFAIRKRR